MAGVRIDPITLEIAMHRLWRLQAGNCGNGEPCHQCQQPQAVNQGGKELSPPEAVTVQSRSRTTRDPGCGRCDQQSTGIVDHMPGISHQRQRTGPPADARFHPGKPQCECHGEPDHSPRRPAMVIVMFVLVRCVHFLTESRAS